MASPHSVSSVFQPFSFSTYSSLALFGIRPPFIKIYLHFSRSVGQSRVVCIYHRYPPGGVLILLLLLMCRTTVKSANCAMNWNETTIAGAGTATTYMFIRKLILRRGLARVSDVKKSEEGMLEIHDMPNDLQTRY